MGEPTDIPAHIRQRGDFEAGDRAASYPPEPTALAVAVYDNHAHLEFADGDNPMDFGEHLDRAGAVGVAGVVQVGTDVETSTWSVTVAASEPRVLAAVSLHPNEAPRLFSQGKLDAALAAIDDLASKPRVVAIGETGLDHHRTPQPLHDAQRQSFIEHIRMAKAHNLALQIHDRDAHQAVVETLLAEGAPERTVFHCFSGDRELAEILVANGWYASFSGTVTFKNSEALREALRAMPSSHILVETDTPFLTPMPFRGKPNSPYMIPHTVRAMAATLEMDEDSLCTQLTSNTHAVYGHWDGVAPERVGVGS